MTSFSIPLHSSIDSMNHNNPNTHEVVLYSVAATKISSMNKDHTPLHRSFGNDADKNKNNFTLVIFKCSLDLVRCIQFALTLRTSIVN